MCNADIKEKMQIQGVRQWQIAEYLGMSESLLSRKMRHDLEPDLRDQVNEAIRVLGSPPGMAKIRGAGSGLVINK